MWYVSEQPNPLEQNARLRYLAWLLVPVLMLLTCCWQRDPNDISKIMQLLRLRTRSVKGMDSSKTLGGGGKKGLEIQKRCLSREGRWIELVDKSPQQSIAEASPWWQAHVLGQQLEETQKSEKQIPKILNKEQEVRQCFCESKPKPESKPTKKDSGEGEHISMMDGLNRVTKTKSNTYMEWLRAKGFGKFKDDILPPRVNESEYDTPDIRTWEEEVLPSLAPNTLHVIVSHGKTLKKYFNGMHAKS